MIHTSLDLLAEGMPQIGSKKGSPTCSIGLVNCLASKKVGGICGPRSALFPQLLQTAVTSLGVRKFPRHRNHCNLQLLTAAETSEKYTL